MGFLNRIDELNNAQRTTTEYVSNALKRITLTKNAFKCAFVNSDELALKNPIQFIYRYLNREVIDNALFSNQAIQDMLISNHLSFEYKLENVSSIIASHLVPTARTVHKIYYNLNKNPRYDKYIALMQAALLHDIGKVFIPSEILNKNGKLSSKERYIIELHNKFSYEILKTTDLKPQAVRLALEHHNYDNCFNRTPENQALMIADIYCALRESRPYKRALSDISAKTILYDMGTSGMFDAGYIKYLW